MPKRRLELRGENTYRKARIVFLSYHQMGGGDAHKCTTHTVTRERPRRRLWYGKLSRVRLPVVFCIRVPLIGGA